MKRRSLILLLVAHCTVVLTIAGNVLNPDEVEWFYNMCWKELSLAADEQRQVALLTHNGLPDGPGQKPVAQPSPPALDSITPELARKELQGDFTYRYLHFERTPTNGEFSISFPAWNWPTDNGHGKAQIISNKIILLGLGEEDDMRAFLLRIGGKWHIMQMDFPGGLVELKKK
ncbi:MAG: hypothetical protein K8T26_20670 [Lentisphaerae bacterium]|nr:hypothetical protein [Lentisphaerota bacterium]